MDKEKIKRWISSLVQSENLSTGGLKTLINIKKEIEFSDSKMSDDEYFKMIRETDKFL